MKGSIRQKDKEIEELTDALNKAKRERIELVEAEDASIFLGSKRLRPEDLPDVLATAKDGDVLTIRKPTMFPPTTCCRCGVVGKYNMWRLYGTTSVDARSGILCFDCISKDTNRCQRFGIGDDNCECGVGLNHKSNSDMWYPCICTTDDNAKFISIDKMHEKIDIIRSVFSKTKKTFH